MWWLASNDFVGDDIYEGTFERPQRRFVERFLRPGMVMFDIGAHHGLYSLIGARSVGRTGTVVAFEPSPRERSRLELHRRINRLPQIVVEPVALGSVPGTVTLFVQDRRLSGFNSLHPSEQLRARASKNVEVPLSTIDAYLEQASLSTIDLVKMDVEGGELEVLRGAKNLLEGSSRPIVVAEVEDDRTRPWGYDAAETVRFLESKGYTWFEPRPGGMLGDFDTARDGFSDNLVAVPPERMDDVAGLLP
jgi:FkbM family methyltransferase